MTDQTTISDPAQTRHMIHPGLEPLATPIHLLDHLPGNPHKGDVAAVARSYATFGQRKPIVARRQPDGRGVVLGGNTQLDAARQLGWSHIAVVWVDDDDQTATAWALADNRTAELGTNDTAALVALLGELDRESDLFSATGWTGGDLDGLLRELDKANTPSPEPDPIPVPDMPTTRLGDVWALGPHLLICGDSTNPNTLSTLMGNGTADMVWTDPPYGVSVIGGDRRGSEAERKAKGGKTIQNDDLTPKALGVFLGAAFDAALTVCRPGTVWMVASPGGHLLGVFCAELGKRNLWRHTIIWVKDVLVLSRADYHYRHEPMFYGWVEGAPHIAPNDRKQDSVWEIPRPRRSPDHPTMKPVALVERAIVNHTTPGQVVLDPFGGSGTTLLAAQATGRRARLVELSPGYCDVIVRRWEDATGEKATRLHEA